MEITFETLENDIPYETAERAYYFISFEPEKRARNCRDSYRATMHDLAHYIKEHAKDEKQEAIAQGVFDKLRNKYKNTVLAMLASKSRCASSAVVGGGNFNVARAEKRNDIAHRREGEVYALADNLKKMALKRLNSVYTAQEKQSSDIENMRNRLASAKEQQENMKEANKAHRAFLKDQKGEKAKQLIEALPVGLQDIVRTYKPAYSWEPHPFAPFQLQNNNASIKRMEKRLKMLETKQNAAQEHGEIEQNYNGLKVVRNFTEDRLQLIFEGKPDEDVRALLKSNGFRWSRKFSAWQRKLTNNATYSLKHYVMSQDVMQQYKD